MRSRTALERLLNAIGIDASCHPVIASIQQTRNDPRQLERVSICTKCPHLASSRTQTVFGVGNPDAEIMFIGEAPGADERCAG